MQRQADGRQFRKDLDECTLLEFVLDQPRRKLGDAEPCFYRSDVPFYDPSFGDVGQILDPIVYAGWLAAQTTRIAIGTAGIVLPLRDPLIVGKQAASVDQLLRGRFLLGLSTGNRASEFAAFGSDLGNRSDRYRDAIGVIRVATEQSFARHASRHYGTLDGTIDMVPNPVGPRLPILAIGRAGQTLE